MQPLSIVKADKVVNYLPAEGGSTAAFIFFRAAVAGGASSGISTAATLVPVSDFLLFLFLGVFGLIIGASDKDQESATARHLSDSSIHRG
jgi:hypothetical protein